MTPTRSRALPLLLGILLTVVGVAGAPAGAQTEESVASEGENAPSLSFEERAITVSGLTPGAEAVLFGVAVRAMGYYNRIERYEEVLFADALGTAWLELPDGLPPRAVWAVVDLTTGALSTTPTPGFPSQAQPFPTAGLRGQGAGLDRFGHSLREAHVLFVRPGPDGGVWGFALDDGSGYDLDGAQDGAFELSLAQLHPVGAASPEPPAEILPGDVLVVVDLTELSLFTLRVPAGLIP